MPKFSKKNHRKLGKLKVIIIIFMTLPKPYSWHPLKISSIFFAKFSLNAYSCDSESWPEDIFFCPCSNTALGKVFPWLSLYRSQLSPPGRCDENDKWSLRKFYIPNVWESFSFVCTMSGVLCFTLNVNIYFKKEGEASYRYFSFFP